MPPSSDQLPAATQRVAAALAGLGAGGTPRRGLPDPLPAGHAVVHTHVFEAGGRPLVVVGHARPDPVDLAGALGIDGVREVPDPIVTLWTGQDPGAVAPVGHAEPVSLVIDINLAQRPALWVPAGSPGFYFPTTYSELLRITAGTAAEVGELP